MAILHDYALSGNCYKIRLFAALAGVALDLRPVDFYPGREHRSPAFLRLNPAGTLPVLEDGGEIVADSGEILIRLAERHAPDWLPRIDSAERARWLAFADTLTATSGEARLALMIGKPVDIPEAQRGAAAALRGLDDHLAEQRLRGIGFIVGNSPSILDIACFPYAALAPDGGVELDAYPDIRDWILRIRTLPRFVTMPGIHSVHERL